MSDFKKQGNQIFSAVTGDLVAVIDQLGNLKMQPGKNALTPRVKAFYEEVKDEPDTDTHAAPAAQAAEKETEEETKEETKEVDTNFFEEELSREHIAFGDAPNKGGTSAPAREKKETPAPTAAALSVWDIPENSLPEFSPALGVAGPGFRNFVKKHHLTKEQVIELIKRLEKRKG